MIADHFWKFLFLVFAIAGVLFWYKNYDEKRTQNNLSLELAEFVDFSPETMPKNEEEAQQRFIKAVALIHNARNEGTDLGALVDAALTHNELNLAGTRAGLIRSAIFKAENRGEELGIFDENSLWELEEGKKVKVVEGPYAGDFIAIIHQVPAAIAKGAEFFPGNFALVPESVAALSQDIVVTKHVYKASGDLAAADVISAADANLIQKRFYRYRDSPE